MSLIPDTPPIVLPLEIVIFVAVVLTIALVAIALKKRGLLKPATILASIIWLVSTFIFAAAFLVLWQLQYFIEAVISLLILLVMKNAASIIALLKTRQTPAT